MVQSAAKRYGKNAAGNCFENLLLSGLAFVTYVGYPLPQPLSRQNMDKPLRAWSQIVARFQHERQGKTSPWIYLEALTQIVAMKGCYTGRMPIPELVVFLLIATAAWLWLDSVKAREIAVQAAHQACAQEGAQLLDETVEIRSFRLARNTAGRLRPMRKYSFEFSDTGDNRRSGWIVLLGHEVDSWHLHRALYLV